MRCPAISAVAAATSASKRPCAPPRRERDMTIHRKHELPVITNVSRRGVLAGLGAGSAFVLAAQFPALAAPPFYPTGAEAMPNKTVSDPHVFISIASDGTVTIIAARAEMGTGAARAAMIVT